MLMDDDPINFNIAKSVISRCHVLPIVMQQEEYCVTWEALFTRKKNANKI